jgi:ribonuclease P protein 1
MNVFRGCGFLRPWTSLRISSAFRALSQTNVILAKSSDAHRPKLKHREMFINSGEITQKVSPTMSKYSVPSDKEAEAFLNNLTPHQEKILKALKVEYDYLWSTMAMVPSQVTSPIWAELIQCFENGYNYRCKRWKWHCLREVHAIKKKKRAAERAEESDEEFKVKARRPFFVHNNSMDKFYQSRLYSAQQFGRQLVLDCGYEECMGTVELNSLVLQTTLLHSFNKLLRDPYAITFSNLGEQSILRGLLQQSTGGTRPGVDENDIGLPYTYTSKDFTELFPHEDLIMLSPDTPRILKEVRPDKVYVIGAITDRAKSIPLTYAKSKRLGLPSFRLPLHLIQ